VTESPETPTPSLAERLDEDATYWRDLHAEAVRLRRLA
jgi:hypothetical protein